MEKYLTAEQIHDLYNLSQTTLLRWEKNGQLHPIKTAGGHRRYQESEVAVGENDRDGSNP